MLARQNVLEDARYSKVVPNDYLVELNTANYQRCYQPVEKLVCQQWQERLLEALNTTNSRQGRKEYRFGGRVRIRIQPVANLNENEVRIHCHINPEIGAAAAVPAYLELLSGKQQWPLREEITVIGRDGMCDIFLDLPLVQKNRLVSGQHAYIRQEKSCFCLYDGTPEGKASVNGTFVNGQRVSPAGHLLQAGDVIILASLDPHQPRVDTPGVVAFRFRAAAE
ncbi:MAG: hypothetical protein BroJett011_46840 [Chloroflexota bacterium]|nr:MAG: hypothetical protein BroJett011_46840 [Chloroflexota bacterium]